MPFRLLLSILLLLAAAGWLMVGAWGDRDLTLRRAEYGGVLWLRWVDGQAMTGTHADYKTNDGKIGWALQHMQKSMNRPLRLLWLRHPESGPVLVTADHFFWGCVAAAVHPGRILVTDQRADWPEVWPEVDGVFAPLTSWDAWQRTAGMERLNERFPHQKVVQRWTRFAVTSDLAVLVEGLDNQNFWPKVMQWAETDPRSARERQHARWWSLLWTAVFFLVLGLQGWLLLNWLGLAGALAHTRFTSPWITLPVALAVGSVMQVTLLWLLGALGISMGSWTWRGLHLTALMVVAVLLSRQRDRGRLTKGSPPQCQQSVCGAAGTCNKGWSVTGVLAVATGTCLLLLASGPGPLWDAPGVTRDGYKAERFFEHGGMTLEALLPEDVTAIERGFSRPAYPPAWPGLAYAMALWCGDFDSAPFNVLPMVMLSAALCLLGGLAMGWLPAHDAAANLRRAAFRALWLAIAISVSVLDYCGRFYSEPWLLLLLVAVWALWLGATIRGDAESGRLPWPQVLLAAVLLGALCAIKREGMLWAGLGLVALPFVPGIDWRRWLATAGLVCLWVLPVLAWRWAVGAALEDFSWQSLATWRGEEILGQRIQETWAEVRSHLWRWPQAYRAFALVVPIGLLLWLLTLPGHLVAATPGKRWRVLRQRLGQAAPLAVVIFGGTLAIVIMFVFSQFGSLHHHLIVVWRLMLPVAAAACLLTAMALSPPQKKPTS